MDSEVSALQEGPAIRLWDLSSRRVLQRHLGHFQAAVQRDLNGFQAPKGWEKCMYTLWLFNIAMV